MKSGSHAQLLLIWVEFTADIIQHRVRGSDKWG